MDNPAVINTEVWEDAWVSMQSWLMAADGLDGTGQQEMGKAWDGRAEDDGTEQVLLHLA